MTNKTGTVEGSISEKGNLLSLSLTALNSDAEPIEFRNDEFAGPSLLLNGKPLLLKAEKADQSVFYGENDSISYSLKYLFQDNSINVIVTCQNKSGNVLTDLQFTMQLGINTAMVKYPEWRSVFFPTLLRCEKTHFWGYLMNPNGRILSITSPNPIASYRLMYNNKANGFGSGHLIRTISLDLLNPAPLPERHPNNSDRLLTGEKREWVIQLEELTSVNSVIKHTAIVTGASMIESDLYSIGEGETAIVNVYSNSKPKVEITGPDNSKQTIKPQKKAKGIYQFNFSPTQNKGVYKITAKNNTEKITEANITLRYPWSHYALSARKAAVNYPQKASSHTESWYGLFSGYIAQEIFPDTQWDEKINTKFDEIYPLMYDTITNLPTSWHDRIQNHSMMASLFVQRYKATKNIKDLRAAANLADFILTKQSSDGAYRNGKVHYTSVIYVAKSIMEVMEEEKKLVTVSPEWKENYKRHFHSVKKAIDELTLSLDNVQTEGEMTYEDCMIASGYGQIALFALLQPEDSPERKRYIEAAQFLLNGHRCLSQIVIPDSRMNGGSLRFWESQYDILTFPNMLNSPHGWSAWRIYGLKYMYELTGNADYLIQMKNALGSCVQLINPETDKLNWAFVPDPYVKANIFIEDTENKGKGKHVPGIIGEQYMPMISDWYKAPADTWVTGYWGYDGGNCDNDVHEIFKCLGELVLTSSYVHQKEDGSYITWNCEVQEQNGTLRITPSESCVSKVHFNTSLAGKVDIMFGKGTCTRTISKNGWVTDEEIEL
ncbi:MAG: hypothetical protein ABFS16_15930 [Bacteroidota bacterium]